LSKKAFGAGAAIVVIADGAVYEAATGAAVYDAAIGAGAAVIIGAAGAVMVTAGAAAIVIGGAVVTAEVMAIGAPICVEDAKVEPAYGAGAAVIALNSAREMTPSWLVSSLSNMLAMVEAVKQNS